MKLIIASGSLGKYFHLKEFNDALIKLGIDSKLVKEIEYSNGFPSKKISEWFFTSKKFKRLIQEFKPDTVFVDRQLHFANDVLKTKIPLFILLRGHYWSEIEWSKKTKNKGLRKIIIWFRNRIAEKCFENATAIFPICKWLENVVKEYHPRQKTYTFFEGIDESKWFYQKGTKLIHPCVGLLQDANTWEKTKEMLILKNVVKALPNIHFYWAGGGFYQNKILESLNEFNNFHHLGRLDYPEKVREFLSEIDIYALVSGMDMAPLTLKEAELMEKPVLATKVGGIPEMMDPDKSGFLIDKGDYQKWIEKISLLSENKELAKKLGSHGKKFVVQNFSWDVIAKEFLKNINNHLKQ